MDRNRKRPVTTEDEIDRTGRVEQVAPEPGLAAATSPRRDGLDVDDAPQGGVDTDDFPGAGAP